MGKIRRVCLFAGAGAGKSTLAYWLSWQLKRRHKRVELVQEYVKLWAYKGIVPKNWDQLHIFNKQLRREEELLKNGVDLIVTDSPVFLATTYSSFYNSPFSAQLYAAHDQYNSEYDPVNIFLEREDTMYQQNGRYQDLTEAKKFDAYLLGKMSERNLAYTSYKVQPEEPNEDDLLDVAQPAYYAILRHILGQI